MRSAPPPLKLQLLHFKTVEAGAAGFGKITESRYPNPLGFNRNAESRFSDPRNIPAENKFGVIYFGENFETCFVETLIRDELAEKEKVILPQRSANGIIYVPIKILQNLLLLDLTHGNFLPLHIHSDTLRGASHTETRKLAAEIYNHSGNFDGILFESRFTSNKNIALFDRALNKITAEEPVALIRHSGFSETGDKYLFTLSFD